MPPRSNRPRSNRRRQILKRPAPQQPVVLESLHERWENDKMQTADFKLQENRQVSYGGHGNNGRNRGCGGGCGGCGECGGCGGGGCNPPPPCATFGYDQLGYPVVTCTSGCAPPPYFLPYGGLPFGPGPLGPLGPYRFVQMNNQGIMPMPVPIPMMGPPPIGAPMGPYGPLNPLAPPPPMSAFQPPAPALPSRFINAPNPVIYPSANDPYPTPGTCRTVCF